MTADRGPLNELRALAVRRLGPLLQRVLERADDALFDLSQQGSGNEQAEYFEAMRELRRVRAGMPAQLVRALHHDFERLTAAPAPAAAANGAGKASGLSLLDGDALEEQLACEQAATSIERRHQQSLARLADGLGKLVQPAAFDASDSPLAPLRLAQGLRSVLAPALPQLPARLVVLKWFERELGAEYGAIVDDCVRVLIARGIPVEAPPPRRSPDSGRRRAPEAAAPATAAAPAAALPRAGDAAGGTGEGSEAGDALLAVMRSMFASYLGDPGAGGGNAVATPAAADALDTPALVAMLGAMQRQPPPALLAAVDDHGCELGLLLQRELLARAPRGIDRLQERDEQGLTLVGMLFDTLLDQGHFERGARERLVRLVVPYAKVALVDRRMFAHKTHPARQLLNALAEACDGNFGDSPGDRDTMLRVTAVCDRLLRDFADDPALFVELEQRFSAYLEQHRRRVSLAERRATETQRGRERLEEARADAALELASLVGEHPAPRPVADFLRRDWTHHLTVVGLREGTDSEAYRRGRAAGVSLWLALLACERGEAPPAEFGSALLPVLHSSGLSGEPAQMVIEQMRVALLAVRAAALPQAAVAGDAGDRGGAQEPGLERVSAVAEHAAADLDAAAAGMPATAHVAAPADVAAVAALKEGDWVEIGDQETGMQPVKLSWISPISGRLLFVNRRGMRHGVLSPQEAAALHAAGRLRVLAGDSPFERALTQMVGRLRGGAAAAAEQP